jgi:hypothetical protein
MSMNDIRAICFRFVRLGLGSIAFLATATFTGAAATVQTLPLQMKEGKLAGAGAELKESGAIYQLWMSGRNYENNARRARLLAKNFLAAYKSAAEPQPKIVFKMGIEHVALGTTTVNTIDLGTLGTSVARANGQTALRIAFLPMGGQNTVFAPKTGNPATVQTYESKEVKEFCSSIGLDAATLSKGGGR